MQLFTKHEVDAVLHGHYHENMEYTRNGLHFINGGGSVLGAHPAVVRLNILHLSPKEVRVEHREFPLLEERSNLPALKQREELLTSHAAA